MTPEQFDKLIEALHWIAGVIVFHAFMSPPSTSGISSALKDIAREIKGRQ